jgi:hypothetical protein
VFGVGGEIVIRLGMTYNSLTPIDYKMNDNGVRTIKIKIGDEEKEYCVVSVNISKHRDYGWWDFHLNPTVYSYELEEINLVHVKTKEQKAAEESVAKAKEALKAAENALKAVKQSK